MAIWLSEKGHRNDLLVYITLFGLVFLTSSIIYLVNLHEFNIVHCNNVTSGSDLDVKVSCEHMFEWKRLATMGIIYGSLSLLAASLTPLCPMLWTCCEDEVEVMNDVIISRDKIPRDEEQHDPPPIFYSYLHRLHQKSQIRRLRSSFVDFLKSSTMFLTIAYWITSFIMPTYLAVGLVISKAIRADRHEDSLYFPAVAVAITCVLNLLVVVVACLSVSIEKVESENESPRRRSNVNVSYVDTEAPSSSHTAVAVELP